MTTDETSPHRQLMRDNPDLVPTDTSLDWFIYSTHISLRHKFIFVETPKAACSTMKRMLQRLEVGDPRWERWGFHLHDRQFSPLLTPLQVPNFSEIRRDPSMKKFCVVRSPHTRLLSAYLDKICRDQPQKAAIVHLLGGTDNEQTTHVSFLDFVSAVERQNPDEMDLHWRPQTLLLRPAAFAYDLFLHAEQLDGHVQLLGELLGCDLSPFYGRIDAGRTDADLRLGEYYSDPELFRKVSRIYADDLALLLAEAA
jgi:hypothetical protein